MISFMIMMPTTPYILDEIFDHTRLVLRLKVLGSFLFVHAGTNGN